MAGAMGGQMCRRGLCALQSVIVKVSPELP